VLFAPWLLVTEHRRATVAFAVTFVIALAAPMALYGFGGNIALLRDWWQTVTTTTAPNLLGTDNISFMSMWAKWIGPSRVANALAALTGAACLGLIADAWRRRANVSEPAYLEAAALLVLVPVLSPQGWDYVLLLATPAVVLLLDRLPELSRTWRIATWTAMATSGLVIFDVVGKTLYRGFMALNVVSLCAIAFVVLLGHLRRERLA
jgi:hypothetical protein